jgi:hypothetical protein
MKVKIIKQKVHNTWYKVGEYYKIYRENPEKYYIDEIGNYFIWKEDCEIIHENINIFKDKWCIKIPADIINEFEEFKKQIMNNKKIIGYKAPFDMEFGNVKKGDVFKKFHTSNNCYEADKNKYILIPKEIVERWEPVFEEIFESEEVVLNGKILIINSKQEILVKNTSFKIKIEELKIEINLLNQIKYSINNSSIVELNKIIETYYKLNPKD